jgi:16S rRNA processing protein RimM
MPNSLCPVVGGEEFYHADPIGLTATNEAGEVARADGGETLLLPFTKAVFPKGDIEAGHLTVVPPAAIEAKPPER